MSAEPIGAKARERRAHAAAVREWARRDERLRRISMLAGLIALAAAVGLALAALL
ncbi:hypothetical protein PV371_38395 [Streptomyces sp. TX20-6-3]|uniref:hypothetical protein n=1 Tax=Streptomyces sp. TX20-6-3 TaxID=3028705 RepID=UPI0029BE70B2|nr:hypothetical protein [Streptomyces sp. TX20-6-3]MDX2565409.1 hypothetical protein [Streptomyces sp. TX20-6-3]